MSRLYDENMQRRTVPSNQLITSFENSKLQASKLKMTERALDTHR